MSCKGCEKAQEQDGVAYYRWGKANIGMTGCNKHLREIFEILTSSQKKYIIMAEQDKHNLADVSKHTPGPWETSKNQGSSWEIYTDESWIANVYPGYGQKIETEFRECEANARLIAAAPDLLKACEAWEKAVKYGGFGIKDFGSAILADEAVELTKAALELAKKGA